MLSIVLPAYNECSRIGGTLRSVFSYVRRKKIDAEVIVVDDGSTDGMAKSIGQQFSQYLFFERSLAKRDKSRSSRRARTIILRIISYPQNRGKGYAVKKGVLAAHGNWILMMDADGDIPIEMLDRFAVHRANCDVLIGSRYLKRIGRDRTRQPLRRLILSRAGNLLTRLILGLNFSDTQCGFKIFKVDPAKKIFHDLQTYRFGFDMEVLARTQKIGLKIKEVPVVWQLQPGSRFRAGKDALKVLGDLIRIKKIIK